MPVDLTELERVVLLVGEAVGQDVETWGMEHELPGSGLAKLFITRGGVDYELQVRRLKEGSDAK